MSKPPLHEARVAADQHERIGDQRVKVLAKAATSFGPAVSAGSFDVEPCWVH